MPLRGLGGLEPLAIGAARRGARAGDSAAMITADLADAFPSLPFARLRDIAAREFASNQRLNILAELNWGQFRDLSRDLGCGPRGTVTVSLRVYGTDPDTGMPRSFETAVSVNNPRGVTDLLRQAIAGVLGSAREAGSPLAEFGPINRETIAQNVEINYVECS